MFSFGEQFTAVHFWKDLFLNDPVFGKHTAYVLLCSPCERNVDGDNEDKRIMVPCMEQQYVDLKYFPNAPDPDGNLQRKVWQ